MKHFKALLVGLLLTLPLLSCGGRAIVPDPNPPAADVGMKRIEMNLCGQNSVGEAGCILPEGNVTTETLQIFRVLSGSIRIIGQGCGVDYSFQYPADKDPWVSIPLNSLVGSHLASDCVLSIYQEVAFPGSEKVPFPIRNGIGTVTLGTCPAGVKCSFSEEQVRSGWPLTPMEVPGTSGRYLLMAGDQEVARGTFSEHITLDPLKLWPALVPDMGSTLFILGVVSDAKYKIYHRATLFSVKAIPIQVPSFEEVSKGRIMITADESVSLIYVNDVPRVDMVYKFKPKAEGDTIRLYTTGGRTLVVFFKNGAVEWIK